MKARFVRLKFVDMTDCERICRLIITGCIFHNFSHKLNENEEIEFDNEQDPNECDRTPFVCLGSSKKDAETRRQEIADRL